MLIMLTAPRLLITRSHSMNAGSTARSLADTEHSLDAQLAAPVSLETSTTDHFVSEDSTQTLCDRTGRKRPISDEATGPRKHVKGSVASFGIRTQQVFMSDDRSEQKRFAGIYVELAAHRRLLQQISRDQRLIVASNPDTASFWNSSDPINQSDANDDNHNPGSVSFVLDCVSRFAQEKDASPLERLHTNCCGSPIYHLESKTSFFPEQYTLNGPVSERIVVTSMFKSSEDHRKDKIYLRYAQDPRRWRRVIVSVIHPATGKPSTMRHFLDIEDPLAHVTRVLPTALESLLNSLLPGLDLDHRVTSFTLSLREDDEGALVPDLSCIVPTEDCLEAKVSDEVQWVQDVRHMGCVQFSESQIFQRSQLTPRTRRVLLGSRSCTEVMVPFATSGPRGNYEYKEFLAEFKLLKSLQGCSGIPEIVGVVLDDARSQLKGFLYEAPAVISLETTLTAMIAGSKTISWPMREFWARKLIEAISDIHCRGHHVGLLRAHTIGFRADGTPLLTLGSSLKSAARWVNKKGLMPPELREGYNARPQSLLKTSNFQTDIFQLGLILWQVAELQMKPSAVFCARDACTHSPSYMCNAEHKNPVELPPCSGNNVPIYFNDLIRACRSREPASRPSAFELVRILSDAGIGEATPAVALGLRELDQMSSSDPDLRYLVYCDECDRHATDSHYHCNICDKGDFDLCQTCFEEMAIRCRAPESHHLTKRGIRDGRIVSYN